MGCSSQGRKDLDTTQATEYPHTVLSCPPSVLPLRVHAWLTILCPDGCVCAIPAFPGL